MNRPLLSITLLTFLTIARSGFAQHEICYAPASLGTYNYVESIDFDGDGFQDIAATSSSSLQILKGLGDGTFQTPVSYTVGTSPSIITLADFNNDLEIDLTVLNSNSISILLGNGDATFQAAINVAIDGIPTSAVVFDADENGKSDLIIGKLTDGQSVSKLSVLLGNGNGTFTSNGDILFPYKLAAADFNSDGHFDVAGLYPNALGSDIKIALGNGLGAFTLGPETYQTVKSSPSIAIGDFNNDNKKDIVATNNIDLSISVFLGDGDGTFANRVTYPTIAKPYGVTVTDFNLDGKYDLIIDDSFSNIQLLSGDGTGAFTAKYQFKGLSNNRISVTVADFNEDGTSDVSTGTDIYLSRSSLPQPNPQLIQQPTCTLATGLVQFDAASTGTGYTYSYNNAQTFGTSASGNLAAGNYNLRYKSAAGCVSQPAAVVMNAQPATPAKPEVTITQPTCTTQSLITITKQNDTDTYRIGTSGSFQTSNTISGYGGQNTVTIKNAAGCTSTSDSFTVNFPLAVPPLPQVSVIQPTCTSTASITISNGQVSTNLFTFDDGANYQSSVTKSNLVAGAYKVRIKNASGCVSEAKEVVINESASSPPKPEVTVVQATCTADATITVTKQNDTDVYSFGEEFMSSNVKSGVQPGTYDIMIRNAGGCFSAFETVTIDTYPTKPSQPTFSLTQPTCTTATGSIQIYFQLDVSNYSFDGGETFQSVNSKSGLASGEYNIAVKSSSGCVAKTNATINAQPLTPAKPTITINEQTGEMQATPGAASYKWYLNGNLLPGTTAFQPSAGIGPYTVAAVSEGGCVSPLSGSYLITGVYETTTGTVMFYPNPSKDYIYLRAEKGTNWKIIGVKGEQSTSGKIEQDGLTTIDVRELNSGIYFIKLINSKESRIARFIKL